MSMPATIEPAIKPFDVPAAWEGQNLQDDTSWVYHLTESHRDELLAALDHFKTATHAKGLTAQWLHGHMTPTPDNFPLPTLTPALQRAQRELEEKFGLFLFKGFPVTNLSNKDLHLLHAGLSSHIGHLRAQTVFGEMVQDLQDGGQAPLKERRGSKHNRALPFHNDPSDAIAFLCVKSALTGGKSLFSSSVTIHNAIVRAAPELAETLYEDFYHSYQDYLYVRTGSNDRYLPPAPHYRMPIFSSAEGQFACKYSRFYINQAQEDPAIPRLTGRQIAALDLLEKEMANGRWQFTMQYEPGDAMFINNFICFHARTAFTDDDMDEERRRHLLRIWLSMPNSRPLSPKWKQHIFFLECEAGAGRGGVPVPEISYA
jgi:alpha-ketoglutarate-dependent taurine dioxygenase